MLEIARRRRSPLPALVLGVLSLGALAAGGCGQANPTKETIDQAKAQAAQAEGVPPEQAQVVKSAPGKFDLKLAPTSDPAAQGRTVYGDATCSVESASGELRVAMRPRPESEELYGLSVPGFHGTDTYTGELGTTGARRSSGPVDVGIDQTVGEEGFKAELAISFQGKVAGSAGDQAVQGSARCGLPGGAGEAAQGS